MNARPSLVAAVLAALSGTVTADDSTLTASQVGHDNRTQLVQAGAALSTLAVDQLGNYNVAGTDNAAIYQSATGASLSIEQVGDANLANADQQGYGTRATIDQSSRPGSGLEDGRRSASLTQSGDFVYGSISQVGVSGHSPASLSQTDNGNAITLSQSGSAAGNTAYVTQTGNALVSTVMQTGSGNLSTITQR